MKKLLPSNSPSKKTFYTSLIASTALLYSFFIADTLGFAFYFIALPITLFLLTIRLLGAYAFFQFLKRKKAPNNPAFIKTSSEIFEISRVKKQIKDNDESFLKEYFIVESALHFVIYYYLGFEFVAFLIFIHILVNTCWTRPAIKKYISEA